MEMKAARLGVCANLLVAVLAGMIGPAAAACRAGKTSPDFQPGTVSPMLFGTHMLFNQAGDKMRSQPAFMDALNSIPIHTLRFPGGTAGENYSWERKDTVRKNKFPLNHKASPDDLDFDEFMQVVICAGAQPTIVLNLQSWLAGDGVEGAYKEAEDWVRYSNKEKNYSIRYWEFGNEVYFQGLKSDSPVSAKQYGQYYAVLRKRLKELDPAVELGLVMPPDTGLVAPGDSGPWWDGAIEGAGAGVDYIVIHKYAVKRPPGLLRDGSGLDGVLAAAKAKMQQLLKKQVPIHLTEWNLGSRKAGNPKVVHPDTIGHALFVADALADEIGAGVRLSSFWPLTGPKDQGLLDASNLSLNVPAKVMKMMSPLAGWKIVSGETKSSALQSSVFASPGGRLGAVLINWGKKAATFDWKPYGGPCEGTGLSLQPSEPGPAREALNEKAQESPLALLDGQLSVPAYSVSVVTSAGAKRCSK